MPDNDVMTDGGGLGGAAVRELTARMVQEPDRFPDHGASGPDLPCDENVRRRFFGED